MDNFRDAYYNVLYNGEAHNSRFGVVTSMDGVQVWCEGGYVPRRPKDNVAIGIIEGLQFLAGTASVPAIAAVAPNARLDLFGPSSFYGPRGAWQLESIVRLIEEDPDTRRAVVNLAVPGELPDTLPCTLSLQFLYNRTYNNLDVHAYMRSSDMVWGLPYDLVQFYVVGEAIARCLGLNVEFVHVHAGNMHVYDNTRVSHTSWEDGYVCLPDVRATSVPEWMQWARSVVEACPDARTLMGMFEVPKEQPHSS